MLNLSIFTDYTWFYFPVKKSQHWELLYTALKKNKIKLSLNPILSISNLIIKNRLIWSPEISGSFGLVNIT